VELSSLLENNEGVTLISERVFSAKPAIEKPFAARSILNVKSVSKVFPTTVKFYFSVETLSTQ